MKIIKFLKKHRKKLLQPFSLLSVFFPYIVSVTYFFLALETYIYPGFLKRTILVDLNLLILFCLFSGLMLIVFNRRMSRELSIMTLKLNRFIFPSVVLFFIILSIINNREYDNYIFAKFHIHISRFKLITMYSFLLILLEIGFYQRKRFLSLLQKQIKKSKRVFIYYALAYSLLVLISFSNVFAFFEHLLQYYPPILSHPFAKYEDRSRSAMGFYDYFVFLREYTEDKAVIAIPPQMNPWLTVGNGGYLRYFTYPKKVINSNLTGSLPSRANYAIIAKGAWTPQDENMYHWPKEDLATEKIWYFDINTNQVIESNETTYHFHREDRPEEYRSYEWGLIKLKL